jgi:hypothetical protein
MEASPCAPFNQFLRSRPSFFMCSIALRRRMSRFIRAVVPRLSLRW